MNSFELILFAVLGFASFTSFFLVGMRTTWADSNKKILVAAFAMAIIVFVALITSTHAIQVDNSNYDTNVKFIILLALVSLVSFPANFLAYQMGHAALLWQQEKPSKAKLVLSYLVALVGPAMIYAGLAFMSFWIWAVAVSRISGCEGECF